MKRMVFALVALFGFACTASHAQTANAPGHFTTNPYTEVVDTCKQNQQVWGFEDAGGYYATGAGGIAVYEIPASSSKNIQAPWFVAAQPLRSNYDVKIYACTGRTGSTFTGCAVGSDFQGPGLSENIFVPVPPQNGSSFVVVAHASLFATLQDCGQVAVSAYYPD